ncbi:MAG: SRPBCC family protein [Rhizobiaceae bacterium]
MLRALKWLVYLVIAVVVIVAAGSFLLPAEANVRRSVEIAAPPEKVFAIVGDLRRFQEYSPWVQLDPNATYTYDVEPPGIGQQMSWKSTNENVGSGSQTVILYEPAKHVTAELAFADFPDHALSTWDLEPAGTGTRVTWGFRMGLNGIVERWFGLLFEGRVGPDYEKGLVRLKLAAEKP